MVPFNTPKTVVTGLKERIESLAVQRDRIYVGTATGNLHIYHVEGVLENDETGVTLVESRTNFARKAIEQLGFIKDINSLVALTEAQITLYPLPNLNPPTTLPKTKSAFSFAIHSFLETVDADVKTPEFSEGGLAKAKPISSTITQLVVGCRRRVIIYSWKDSEAQAVKEAPLPHSARIITFCNRDTACLAYSSTEYALFSTKTMTATELSMPLPATSSVTGMGALTGLTGYMTLGLGAKPKPGVVCISDSEFLITRDYEGLSIGLDGKPSRPHHLVWPAPPEETAFIKPYVISAFPAGAVPLSQPLEPLSPDLSSNPQLQGSSQQTVYNASVIQISSSLSLRSTQNLPFPFAATSSATTTNSTIRLLTPSPVQASLFFVTTSTDKATAAVDGTSIWHLCMKPWAEQIDELVLSASYDEALALLDVIEPATLADKERRRKLVRTLRAVCLFRAGKSDDAINEFIDLDVNPAKVVALYPAHVAGRLSVPQKDWISLFGGPTPPEASSHADLDPSGETPPVASVLQPLVTASTSTVLGKLKGLAMTNPSAVEKDDDTASTSSVNKRASRDDSQRSMETLLRYLTDRRPKVAGALATLHITPSQSHQMAHLSETSTEDLFALPDAPLSSLTPEQLLRFAQILDTALFKSYLLMRPALLGSLCRLPNWCEVEEVKEELHAREKYSELIYLYNGKKMHDKALDLLRHLGEKETDMTDRLKPSISYLQKMGPEHLQQIFHYSNWLFEQDPDMAFEIFTSEDVELPRSAVADYLQGFNPELCARYLEYLIEERREDAPDIHDRLAKLYLSICLNALKRGDEVLHQETYAKLLHFIHTTDHYNVAGLYGLLSVEDLFEARAILLGRLGRHDQALELYAYRLRDCQKAEEYCKRVYQPDGPTGNVFLTLLRIYLRPTSQSSADLLKPALDLIRRHTLKLDALETIQLLPPLVTAQVVRTFLMAALRAPVFDTQVVREVSKSQRDQVAQRLMLLQCKRVKVTDSRICPQCRKRIGNSLIAVHAPRGEVTHYLCRDAFAKTSAGARQ